MLWSYRPKALKYYLPPQFRSIKKMVDSGVNPDIDKNRKMANFFVEESDYQQTSGIEFEYVRSGYLNIQPTNDQASEAVDVPFVWWWPQYTYFGYAPSYSYYFSYFWWWDQNMLPEENSAFESELNNLRFVKFELDEDPEEFYYLVLPKLDENPFLDMDGINLELDGYDPTYEDGLFEEILNSSHELVGVEEAELDIADLLDFVALEDRESTRIAVRELSDNAELDIADLLDSVALENRQSTTIALRELSDNAEAPASLPEPSSLGGISVVGVLLLAVMLKRGWSWVWQHLKR